MTTPGAMPKDIRAIIRSIEEGFVRHAGTKDPRAWEAIVTWYEGWLEQVNRFEMIGERLEASGDLAYDAGHYKVDKTGEREEGKFVTVFRQVADGGWKAILHMYSSNHR